MSSEATGDPSVRITPTTQTFRSSSRKSNIVELDKPHRLRMETREEIPDVLRLERDGTLTAVDGRCLRTYLRRYADAVESLPKCSCPQHQVAWPLPMSMIPRQVYIEMNEEIAFLRSIVGSMCA